MTAESTAAKLGLAKSQIAAKGYPYRMKKIPTLRRRIPVTFLDEKAVPVKMRHTGQNLGNVLTEIQPVQNQRI